MIIMIMSTKCEKARGYAVEVAGNWTQRRPDTTSCGIIGPCRSLEPCLSPAALASPVSRIAGVGRARERQGTTTGTLPRRASLIWPILHAENTEI